MLHGKALDKSCVRPPRAHVSRPVSVGAEDQLGHWTSVGRYVAGALCYTSSLVPVMIMPFKVPVTVTRAPTLMFFDVPMVKCVMASQ